MATLILTRGLPGAGKTTRAVSWLRQHPRRRARVNRDEFRAMLHGGWLGTRDAEDDVTAASHAAITALLRRGRDVVCDDTNLIPEHVAALTELAAAAGAGVMIWDMTDVPLATCIARDEARRRAGGHHVGPARIRQMWQAYHDRRGATPVPAQDRKEHGPWTTTTG